MDDSALLDPAAAAAHLGLAPTTMSKMRVHGTGPRFAKLGKAIRYRRADLEAWLNSRLASSTSEVGARHLPRRLTTPKPIRIPPSESSVRGEHRHRP